MKMLNLTLKMLVISLYLQHNSYGYGYEIVNKRRVFGYPFRILKMLAQNMNFRWVNYSILFPSPDWSMFGLPEVYWRISYGYILSSTTAVIWGKLKNIYGFVWIIKGYQFICFKCQHSQTSAKQVLYAVVVNSHTQIQDIIQVHFIRCFTSLKGI